MPQKRKYIRHDALNIYVSMLVFGHTGSMCLEKEVCKARNFVLAPSHEYFCGTDAEFRG